MNVNDFCCALPVLKIVYHMVDLKDRNRGKHLNFHIQNQLFIIHYHHHLILLFHWLTG